MKFLHLLLVVSISITSVVLQDPPPIFDLPPPPPFDSPVAEENVDPAASLQGDTTASENITVTSNETAVNSDSNLNGNDSLLAISSLKTSDNTTVATSANETLASNATDLSLDVPTDKSVVNRTANATGVDTVENYIDKSNLTVITFTDGALTDILAASVDGGANNSLVLQDMQTNNATEAGSYFDIFSNATDIQTDNATKADTSNATAVDSSLLQDTVTQGESLNVSSSVDANATDPLIQTDPVDLPLPPISFETGESIIVDAGSNVSDIQTVLDMNVTANQDITNTTSKNKTYIDEVNIYINDTGITIAHTPVEQIAPGSETKPKSEPAPVPVDVPALPLDKPSVDFIESADSTTIEISDIFGAFAGLSSMDNVSTPMESTAPETTTQEMLPLSTESSVFVSQPETTTQSQTEVYTTQPMFAGFSTSTSRTVATEPSYVHVKKEEIAPPPDHPPPVFSGGSRPQIYTDPYGPHAGYFPVTERTTTPKPAVTKAAPPPPIIVPARPESRSGLLRQKSAITTQSPYPKWAGETQVKQTISGVDPRHMNVAELAAYALQIASKDKSLKQSSQGLQVFFPTEPHTTTSRSTTGMPKPAAKYPPEQGRDLKQDRRSKAFIEYLQKRYGINNVAPTTPYYTTTVKPAIRFFPKPDQRRFYNADYLLSHLQDSTTQKPTLKRFFSSDYLLSHLDIGNSKAAIPAMYTTTTHKPTTARHFFDAKYLLTHLGELQGNRVQDKQADKPSSKEIFKHLPQKLGFNQQSLQNSFNRKPNVITNAGTKSIQGQSIIKEQRQGQAETRPINLKPNFNQQSFINYSVNPERNVRMNINLKPDIGVQKDMNMFTKPPDKSSDSFARLISQVTRSASSFKPVVYGNKPFSSAQQSAGQSLRKRFNKKWYQPKGKTAVKETQRISTAVRNINIQIEEPVSQSGSSQRFMTNTIPDRNTESQNTAVQKSLGNFALQNKNFEAQRQILRQQEIQLQQQRQKLKEQEAVLLRQQQEQQRQQQLQNQLRQMQQQQERDRLIQLKFQQEQREQNQQLASEQKHLIQQRQLQQKLQQELQRQQQQFNQQESLLQQQDHNRLLQLQLQRQLQLEQQPQKEKEVNLQKRGQQLNFKGNQFPLASRTGQSEILPNSQIGGQERHHIYQPNPRLSSIQIFRAPAMLKKRKNKVIQRREQPLPETHWRAPSDLKHLHGHLPVPYTLKPVTVPPITTPAPKPTTPTTNVFIATLPTPVVRRTTQAPIPTEPATADPNPPPIFDTKVRHTFMPMPKIEPTTKAPKQAENNSVSGWGGPQKPNPHMDERCHGCVFVNDRCLLPDPVHCNFFIECVKQGSFVRAFSRECALGSFFDRKSYLCVDPKNADCPTDRCRIPGTKWYAIHGHCKHYWSCGSREGGGVFAQSECCPDMGGFVEPDGCVENPNCTDTCSSPIIMEGPPANSCLPMLSLPFDGGLLQDVSNTKQHIGVEGISATMEGEAIYNGGGRLILWRYANLMFPIVFAVKFRFYSTTPTPKKQLIFSNCDTKGGLEPSVEISLDTMFHEVVFKVNTYTGPAKRFTITYQQNKWTTVDLIYDGERIVGSVDRRARNIFAGGGIETRPNPIGIGSCTGKDGFKGLLDDIFIYEECIPDEMYGVFMSVLE